MTRLLRTGLTQCSRWLNCACQTIAVGMAAPALSVAVQVGEVCLQAGQVGHASAEVGTRWGMSAAGRDVAGFSIYTILSQPTKSPADLAHTTWRSIGASGFTMVGDVASRRTPDPDHEEWYITVHVQGNETDAKIRAFTKKELHESFARCDVRGPASVRSAANAGCPLSGTRHCSRSATA